MALSAKKIFFRQVSAAPLATFRIVFGLAMFVSTVRFLLLGWVEEQYIRPVFHFSYYGFGWVQALPSGGMYGLYIIMLVSSLGILLGALYRWSSLLFFLSFTYVELIDKTYYLNHYYFVSLVAFFMCFVPANCLFSIDLLQKPSLKRTYLPSWCIDIFKFQLGCVYFFAGLAKINSDWLLDAMPLRLWLPAQDAMPLLGPWLREIWVSYVFSWVGMMYDICIPFLLLWNRTRLLAYLVLLLFHALTGYFFQIGVFPLVMSLCTLIFFSEYFHQSLLSQLSQLFAWLQPVFFQKKKLSSVREERHLPAGKEYEPYLGDSKWVAVLLSMYLIIQLVLPWRYLAYPGNLFWTEEGFRFSWRVMLVEKSGSARFRILDRGTGEEFDVVNREFLNTHQEKQMSFQPDMILQYAHFLGDHYKTEGRQEVSVFCECYVTMNGKPSVFLVDPQRDLYMEKESLCHKDWLLPEYGKKD